MIKLTQAVLKQPIIVILLTIVLTIFFSMQLKNMEIDPDISNSLPENIPAKRLYDKMGDIFPSKEFIFLGVEDENIFDTETIQLVWDITQNLEAFPEVYQLMSPTNISIITGTEEGMDVKDILEEVPKTQAEIDHYKETLLSSDLALGNLLSNDSTIFGMMILLKNDIESSDFSEKLIEYVHKIDSESSSKLILAGKPISSYYIGVGMQRDMGTFFGGGILVIFVLLLFIFRTGRGVLIPLIVVIFSVIWTMGLMVFLGFPFSHSITILPILVMAISVADSIHIITHYYYNAKTEKSSSSLVMKTMEDMNIPVIMTSLTTMAGFISLGTVSASSIMTLGLFTAAGVFFALVISLTFVPAVLVKLNIPKKLRESSKNENTKNTMPVLIAKLSINGVKYFYVFVVLLLVFAYLGFSKLSHESSSIENFPVDHPVRMSYDKVNKKFAGSTSFQIMIEGNEIDDIKAPELLKDMDDLKQHLLAQENVGDVQSLADFIKKFNKVLNKDQESYYSIPDKKSVIKGTDWVEENGEWAEVETEFEVDGKELIAQYLQLFEMSGKPDAMANSVDYNYQNAKISVFLNDDKQSVLRRVDDEIEGFLEDKFEGSTVAVTGMAKLILVVDELIVRGQVVSIITSLILVWILTSIIFKSMILGFLNTIPLFFAVILNFIIMGLSGIHINIETMITSSIAIGVGVDYAIHFIYRFRIKLGENDNNYELALAETMKDSGMAILFNSFVVAAGFSIIALSQFVGVSNMGILITLTMITSGVGALWILPMIFLKFKPKSLKN